MVLNVHETETKYDAPTGTALPDLADLPQVASTSGPDEEQLKAEYYDTGDLRLIRAGITLRRRRGGTDAGWHLKLPAGADTRREIRLPLGRVPCRTLRDVRNAAPASSPIWARLRAAPAVPGRSVACVWGGHRVTSQAGGPGGWLSRH
jgi:CYTH domain-containing protein